MQIYRLNKEMMASMDTMTDLIVGDSDETHPTLSFALREWRDRYTRYDLMKSIHQIGGAMYDSLKNNHFQQAHGFGILYRKKGNNYVWRGKSVPHQLVSRLKNGFDEITGDIMLYKRGASTRKNEEHFPLRLSDGRYAFVLGSTQHIIIEAYNRHGISLSSEEYNLVFDLWAQEHLLDYDRLPSIPAMTNPFKNRAQLVWLMENYINDNDYGSVYDDHRTDVGPRAAYCVWQNGNTIRWVNAGIDVHPKVTGRPDPPEA
tara:strand:- start:657 stop:1433 length:777 start_codon:yes stop_codon:yes gene_type:complete